MAKKRKGIFYKIFDNPKIKEYDGHITEEMFNKMFSKIFKDIMTGERMYQMLVYDTKEECGKIIFFKGKERGELRKFLRDNPHIVITGPAL